MGYLATPLRVVARLLAPATQRLKTVQERGVLAIRQKETVVVIDIVRAAPSQAAFSVIADR